MSDDASRSTTTEDGAGAGRRLRPFARPARHGAAEGRGVPPSPPAAVPERVRRAVAARLSAVVERLDRGELALADTRLPASDAAALATVLAALLAEGTEPDTPRPMTDPER